MFEMIETTQPIYVPVPVLAQNKLLAPPAQSDFAFCRDVESSSPKSARNRFSVIPYSFVRKLGMPPMSVEADQWIRKANIQVTLVQKPTHGTIYWPMDAGFVPIPDTAMSVEKSNGLHYAPIQDYEGTDRAVFLARINDRSFRIAVNFLAMNSVPDAVGSEDIFCRTEQFGGASSVSRQLDFSTFDKKSIQITFLVLGEVTVGRTDGDDLNARITLATIAAGHGWFIDKTPLDNEGFLHTMTARLSPGVRRLPMTDELAVLQGLALVGFGDSQSSLTPLSDFNISMLGRLRQTLAGGWGVEYAQVSAPQFQRAVNSTLTNGGFAGSSGWGTRGEVSISSGGSTLTESVSAHSELSHVFILGA
ncbi:MAG: hypothetical protein ACKVQK_16760 [Burkholderiales bacterium]